MVRRIRPGSILFVAAALAVMLSAPALAGLYIPDAYMSPLWVLSEEDETNNIRAAASGSDANNNFGTYSEPADDTAADSNSVAAEVGSSGFFEYTVSVYDAASGRTMVLELEDYIIGVVAGEMPISFGSEALKAQAVAARSYALYKIAHGSQNDDAHRGAQLCTDSAHCKAYVTYGEIAEKWGENKADEVFGAVGEAVRATSGEIMTFGGEAALAVFHSSSDGLTESAAAVWGNSVPYLVSVDTPEEMDPSVVVFTRDQLASAFASDGVSCEDTSLPELIYDEAGRVESVGFGGVAVSGTRVREALGLRSTDFSLVILDGEYIFTVRGYGHGVGMSQYGAAAMAASGADYAAILAHYYPGTSLANISG